MTLNKYADSLPEVLVVTICLSDDATTMVDEATSQMGWRVTRSSLHAHPSSERRPAFGPQIKASTRTIIFLSFDSDPELATRTAEYLISIYGRSINLIAVASKDTPETILGAMRSGCAEFLEEPLAQSLLLSTFDRLDRQWAAIMPKEAEGGVALAFVGAKGGVGATTLAVHAARFLAFGGARVLLIDVHRSLGHVCVHLGLDGSHFLFEEVVNNVGRLDSELLGGFIIRHSSGVNVLASPDTKPREHPFQPETLQRTLEFLRTEYDFLLFDCDRTAEAEMLPLLRVAASVFLIATPDVGAVRDLSRLIDRMGDMLDPSSKVQIVINRFDSAFAIQLEQIEKAIRMPVSLRVPDNFPELVRATNLGEPVAPGQDSEFARMMQRWTSDIAGKQVEKPNSSKVRRLRSLWPLKQAIA